MGSTKKHFVGRAEAGGFVEAAALFGGVQSNDTNAAATSFRESKFDEVAGQAAAAIFGLDIDVEEIAAPGRARVKRMRRPIEQEQARTGNNLAVVFGEPAEITVIGDGLCHPRFVDLGHELEDLIVAAPGIDKHAAPMASDERSVGGSRQPGLQHDEQYKT